MTHWRHGHHPGALFGIECFISEEIGAIYLPGLEKVLYGTLWEYCALRQFYEQTYNPMQVSYYLKMYLQHPLLIERLTKVGFRDIVSDVVYRDGFSDALDERKPKRIVFCACRKKMCLFCWRKCNHGDAEKVSTLCGNQPVQQEKRYFKLENRQQKWRKFLRMCSGT